MPLTLGACRRTDGRSYHRQMPSPGRTAALVLAAVCAGCAPATFLPYRPDQPPTVTLPASRAGIDDARPAFAALFVAELTAAGDTRPQAWLHGAPAAPATVPADLLPRFAARAPTSSVLIVGGLFSDCLAAQSVPFGDGVVRTPERSHVEAYRQYDGLGLRSIRSVPLPGRASSQTNGRLLAEAIRAEAAQPGVQRLVLIAYSKGTADLLHALALLHGEGALPPQPTAIVSISGTVMGTPLADYLEPAYDRLSPLVTPFDCSPSQGGDVASVTRAERIAWLAAHPLPAGPAYYSIVAHVPIEEMAAPLRITGRQLALVDPRNDGQLLAADMVLPGSTLLAEARADHWDIAMPRDRHPEPLLRQMSSGRAYPRETLFRATVKWAVAAGP